MHMSVCVWSSSCSYVCVYIWRVKVSLGYCFPRGDHLSFGDKVSLWDLGLISSARLTDHQAPESVFSFSDHNVCLWVLRIKLWSLHLHRRHFAD